MRAEDREMIVAALDDLARQLGIPGEIKWRKVRPFNADRVQRVMDLFFDIIETGRAKLRVMWLPHALNAVPTDEYHVDHGYYILYYFFVIGSFALANHDEGDEVLIEFYPDTLPDEPIKKRRFINYVMGAHRTARYGNRSPFRVVRVADVDSKKHILLQCSDVVIGALAFLANGYDTAVQDDGTMANGTVVRAAFARHIVERISRIHVAQCGSSYSMTESTWPGCRPDGTVLKVNNWRFAYRQWLFTTR